MKVIILEDTAKSNSIKLDVENRVKAFGGESQLVRRVGEATPHLAKGDIDLVVIHHYGFSDVRRLKVDFPRVKCAGYFGELEIHRQFAEINSRGIGAETIRMFTSHYDYVLYNLGECLDNVLREIGRR